MAIRRKKAGKRAGKTSKAFFGGGGTKKKASKKKAKRKPPRGGKPTKAFLVARDARGRLAGFKKLSMSDSLVKDNL